MSKKLTLDIAKKCATQFMGQCLSTEYHNVETKMQWKCVNGHIFEKTIYDVSKRQRWCPNCEKPNLQEEKCRNVFEITFHQSFPKQRNVINNWELDGYNEKLKLAFEYQGEQHFRVVPKFRNTQKEIAEIQQRDYEKLQLCKEKGINLIQIPYWNRSNDDLQKYIYSELEKLQITFVPAIIDFTVKIQTKLSKLQQIASTRNGELLSTTYDNYHALLDWRCEQKHTWKSSAGSVCMGSWCPFCAGQIVSIEDIKTIAQSKNGSCLSTEYVNAKSKLLFRCSVGHEFRIPATKLKCGQWCPICKKQNRSPYEKLSLEYFQKVAEDRGGKCLSCSYCNAHINLKFQCANGHIWDAKPYHIKNSGNWCNICIRTEKRSRYQCQPLSCATQAENQK